MNKTYALSISFLALVLLFAGIVAAGGFYYRSQLATCRSDAQAVISTIADLKVDELSLWRKERLADASTLYKNAAFSSLVRWCFERPDDPLLQKELRSWIGNIQASYQYDRIALYNGAGDKWTWFTNAKEPISSVTIQKAHEAERSGQMIFADFYGP